MRVCTGAQKLILASEHDRHNTPRDCRVGGVIGARLHGAVVVDPMQAGSAMPLFRQTSRRTLHGELVVKLLPQDFCHCQR